MSRATRLLAIARRRAAFAVLLAAAPWWLGLHIVAWAGGVTMALAVELAIAAAVLVLAMIAARRRDRRWLVRRLDARRGEFEDSADLLFRPPANALQALQRARIDARLAAVHPSALAFGPRARPLLANLGVAAVASAIAWSWPAPAPAPRGDADRMAHAAEALAAPMLRDATITITPPAYTGLSPRHSSALDVLAPQAATLAWSLAFEPSPVRVALRFHDGSTLALATDDAGHWHGERAFDAAARYRLLIDDVDPAADAPAQRIDIVADQPPQLSITAPAQTLTLVDGAAALQFVAEARDDHGLGAAELRLTHAHGDGENVEVRERRIALTGDGDARHRVYRQRLDPAALGFAEGDDLILRLVVADNRAPQAQITQSPAYILRWPSPPAAEAEGFEGLMQRTLPAYFRSQRQIIIDSEALLAERAALAADRFVQRSDAIGVDQRILRLRYGQFLGEETEHAGHALPEGHSYDDGHDHGPAPAEAYGDAAAVVEAYGHTHDQAEAATLFDPATRELLRAALREMWQSELHLRQGAPGQALPYQYRALDYIKQVQQAGRIYLARVGLELPPIDVGRRLSGDRTGVRARPDPLPTDTAPSAVETLWQALDPHSPADGETQRAALDAFAGWLAEHDGTLADPLSLHEAVDRLRLRPDCGDCRARLRAALAPLRPIPAAGVRQRAAASEAGAAYLDALRGARR